MTGLSIWKIEKDRVFWSGRRIQSADPETFEPLTRTWARDKNRIYIQDGMPKGIDRNSFQVLNALWAKDAHQAYYCYGKMPGVDPASFVALDSAINDTDSHSGYAADATQVFHHVMTIGKPSLLRGVHRPSFEVIGPNYGKDQDRVYYSYTRLPGADPNTFRLLGRLYGSDGRKVFYLNREVEGADLETFQVSAEDETCAVDKHGSFIWDKRQ